MSKNAILFPGQGSQKAGMGKFLAEHDKEYMNLWKKAEEISQIPLREIYWESNDEKLMANTKNLQPAITVVNLALWQYCSSYINPQASAGHSLGEFSALAAAKVLDFISILQAVSLRGKLMSEADPDKLGTMFAILRLTADQVDTLCKEASVATNKIVRLANRNTPGQFAISGHKDALDNAIERAQALGGKCISLAVSGAFHTPMMAEANTEFTKYLDKLDWKNPVFPVYCNVNGEAFTEANKIANAMKKQMVSSVYWIETICNQWNDGIRTWYEFGPQGILTRMMRQILSVQTATDSSEYQTVHIPNLTAANDYIATVK